MSQGLREPYWKSGECPRLMKAVCISKCTTDNDCLGELKCCSNGCGRECVAPISVLSPVLNALPIKPITIG